MSLFFKKVLFLCFSVGILFIASCSGSHDDATKDPQSKISDKLTAKEKSYLTQSELSEIDELSATDLKQKGNANLDTVKDSKSRSADKGVNGLKSKTYFRAAYLKTSENNSNDDTVNFCAAMTTIAAIGADIKSDGADNGIEDIGDILDILGVTGNREFHVDQEFSLAFPEVNDSQETLDNYLNSLSIGGKDIQSFLETNPIPELEKALDELNSIKDEKFTYFAEHENVKIELDYGDVLVLKGALKAALAGLNIAVLYNLDVKPADYKDYKLSRDEIFSKNFDLLKIMQISRITEAKKYIEEARENFSEAADSIQQENDDQIDDAIIIQTPEALAEINDYLNRLKNVLDAKRVTIPEDNLESEIDLTSFFNGMNLRDLSPDYENTVIKGFFPDPTFHGTLLSYKNQEPSILNTDINGNGNADIFNNSPEPTDEYSPFTYIIGSGSKEIDISPYVFDRDNDILTVESISYFSSGLNVNLDQGKLYINGATSTGYYYNYICIVVTDGIDSEWIYIPVSVTN